MKISSHFFFAQLLSLPPFFLMQFCHRSSGPFFPDRGNFFTGSFVSFKNFHHQNQELTGNDQKKNDKTFEPTTTNPLDKQGDYRRALFPETKKKSEKIILIFSLCESPATTHPTNRPDRRENRGSGGRRRSCSHGRRTSRSRAMHNQFFTQRSTNLHWSTSEKKMWLLPIAECSESRSSEPSETRSGAEALLWVCASVRHLRRPAALAGFRRSEATAVLLELSATNTVKVGRARSWRFPMCTNAHIERAVEGSARQRCRGSRS